MDTVQYEREQFPVFVQDECCQEHNTHSEMAHWHDAVELILIQKGNVICHAGGDEFPLHKGDVCFINRRQLHRLMSCGDEICGHTVLIIGEGPLSQTEAVYGKLIRPMLEDSRFSHVRFEGNDSPAAKIAALINTVKELQEEKEHGYELDVLAAVFQIFRQLSVAYAKGPAPKPVDGNAIIQQQMAEFIYDHYEESLSLDDIAAAGSVSRSQCTKLFKRYTGLSPIAFLNSHRLELCREKLRRTNDTIAEIASSCGFSDQSYLNRLFLREYGVTPLAYRKSV